MVRAFSLKIVVAAAVVLAPLGLLSLLTVESTVPVTAQSAPSCPAGFTLDVSGNCTAPATATCPAGFTLSGTTCTRPACPPPSFAVDPSVGAPEPGCFDPVAVAFVGVSDPAFVCLAGTTFVFPSPLLGPDPGACQQPPTFTCAVGTLSGQVCLSAAIAGCDGVVIGGVCVIPGVGGEVFADADGGDGGSARGGDGGRGGSGVGGICNQNTTMWPGDAPPTMNCASGGRGGDAGDGGVSEGGDGGLAFAVVGFA